MQLPAALALVGGSMEMMGSGGEWASKHFSAASNTARIAKTWGGMMRLYGGFLGGAAGIVGAVFDGYSAIDAFSRPRDASGIAYAARMMVIGTATVMGATVAFAGSAPSEADDGAHQYRVPQAGYRNGRETG